MTKTELVTVISEKAEISKKDAEKTLKATLEAIEESLIAGDKVQLVGFGTFEIRERAARECRNPQNPAEILKIDACKTPCFKAGKSLKEAVNK